MPPYDTLVLWAHRPYSIAKAAMARDSIQKMMHGELTQLHRRGNKINWRWGQTKVQSCCDLLLLYCVLDRRLWIFEMEYKSWNSNLSGRSVALASSTACSRRPAQSHQRAWSMDRGAQHTGRSKKVRRSARMSAASMPPRRRGGVRVHNPCERIVGMCNPYWRLCTLCTSYSTE